MAALDATSIAFVALLIVGLIALALAVWLLFNLPKQGQANAAIVTDNNALRAVSAEQTRDAQQAEIARLSGELANLRLQLETLATREAGYTMQAPQAPVVLDKAPLALILDVPVLRQKRSLSCESSAAAMAAQFFGLNVEEEAILGALPLHDNPNLGFRGNVDGSYGGIVDYGVYAEPVRQVLRQMGLEAEILIGSTNEIRAHIRQGRPVLVWITYNLQVGWPTRVTTSDGQTVTLIPYEHVVLVTGYNRDGLWVNDPYSGVQSFYPEGDFLRSFAYLGNMGLVVGPMRNS
jgi:uncharacterized protein YvpB